MAGLLRHEPKAAEPVGWFDRVFEDWPAMFPMRWSAGPWFAEGGIRLDEYRDGGQVVIRAELPGIDPAKDLELTVAEGALHIRAERHEEEKREEKGYRRRELRYGSFSRMLPLPEGVAASDVAAAYKDGMLEIRFPYPEAKAEAVRIPVTS